VAGWRRECAAANGPYMTMVELSNYFTTRQPAEAEQTQLLRQAAAAKASFQDLLEAAPDAIVLTHGDGRMALVNRQAEVVFGYHRADLLGQPVERLLPERFQQAHVAHRTRYSAQPCLRPMGVGLTLAGRRQDGSEFPAEVRLASLEVEGERFVTAIIRDVTERQRLEADLRVSELRYRRLFEAARDGILLVDPHTRCITEANPFIADLLGYRRAELVGKELWEVGLLADQAASRAAFRALQADGFIRYENLPLQSKAGERRDVEFVSNVYDEAGQAVIQCNVRDITARHQAEDERAALLAREQAARADAEAGLRDREEFLATVTHDLKQPLTAIQGRVQLLQRQAARHPTLPNYLAGLASIEGVATRMRRLIDQLLDSARLQAGQPVPLLFGDVDLAALVGRVVDQSRSTTEQHAFVVEAAEGDRVEGRWDADRLEQVLANLLSNAVKYSPDGGAITITLRREADAAGAWAWLTVQDEGLGIPAADLPHVFERFHRGSNVDGHFPGMGIGLAGARAIVEQHGGTLQVTSQEGVGSRFTVRLPLPQ
jgi:PAS domain S-box-containing protein